MLLRFIIIIHLLFVSSAALYAQENESDLSQFEIGDDDFDFESKQGKVTPPSSTATDRTGTGTLDNYSAGSEADKLDLSEKAPLPVQNEEQLDLNGLVPTAPDKISAKPQPSKPAPASAALAAPAAPVKKPAPAAKQTLGPPPPAAAPVVTQPAAPVPQNIAQPAPTVAPQMPEPAPIAAPLAPTPAPEATVAAPASPAPDVSVSSEPATDLKTAEVVAENEYGGTPFIPGGRRVMASGEAPEYYKVEPGDSLYDICDQLIDEPSYWPKLWALNPGIKNPHFIFPGMALSFYPGDDATPPYLQVVAEDDVLPIETGGFSEAELIAQPTADIATKSPDESTMITSSLEGKFYSVPNNFDTGNEFEYFGNVYVPNVAKMEIPAFIFNDEVEELGAVVAGPWGQVHVMQGDDVVIEKVGNLSQGSVYTIVRPYGSVDNADGDRVGYRYQFIGHVKITGSSDDEDALIGKVIKARLGVRPDDLIIDFKSVGRSYNTEIANLDAGQKDASIIGFEYETQTMGSEGGVVFVDKLFTPGTTLPVYQGSELRFPKLLRISLPNVTSRVGVIKIVDQVGNASVGVVLKSTMDLKVGDRLGRG